jgi:hypothetical protein
MNIPTGWRKALLCGAIISLLGTDGGQARPRSDIGPGDLSLLDVCVTSPNGGEIWEGGETRTISWDVSAGADIVGVTIRWSMISGLRPEEIVRLQGNPGSYEWQVPRISSTNCVVSVELVDAAGNLAEDQSDSAFIVKVADNRPDLIVILKSTELLSPLQDVTVTVTVKNNGAGPAPQSNCDIFIRNGHAPRETVRAFKRVLRALGPGDQYSFSFSIKLGLGLYEIAATADRKKRIPEADETNNETRIIIEGK